MRQVKRVCNVMLVPSCFISLVGAEDGMNER